MPSIYETLDQEEVWYGQDGYPWGLKHMETSHIENTLAFLRRRAEGLYKRRWWYEFTMMRDAPEGVFDAWMVDAKHELEQDPTEWLNSRPLVKAMEKELRERNTIEGELVEEPAGTLSQSNRHLAGSLLRLERAVKGLPANDVF